MKSYFTLSLALLAASVAGSAYAENPYAPTGNETVIGQTQMLYYAASAAANELTGADIAAGDGWKMQITGNATKTLSNGSDITIDGQNYKSIKLSNGAQNTITIPEGYVANAVTVYSFLNVDAIRAGRICYFKEVDGEAIAKPADNYLTVLRNGKNAVANPDVSYFKLKGTENSFTLTNDGEQACVVLVVDYSEKKTDPEPVDPGFGEGVLAVSNVWPKSGNTMLPLQGEFLLTFPADVTVAGKADLNGTALDMTAEAATVKIPYTGLTAATEYTLTIPAKAIGNAEGAIEALTYTFTTRPANVLFYSDFKQYPYAYFQEFGNITATTELFGSTSATNVTKEYEGMIFFSGTSGRCAIMTGASNGATTDVDYGPETEADFGASDYCAQMIGGSGSYIQFPEVEGPVELTLYIANPNAKDAPVVKLTDQDGDLENPLASFAFNKTKRMRKLTYSYPYKGKVSFRIYNMGKKIDVNDVLIVKGEGEGIDKPADETAPVLVKAWPSDAPYAPLEGNIVLEYNEKVVIAGKAVVNGVETNVTVDGKKATIAYSGFEAGKSYTVTIPAVADEAGNELAASEMTINTAAADVLYYTDYNFYPYAYWEKFNQFPNASADNGDIFPKNTSNKETEIGGLRYVVGATAGRIVAMGKPNLIDDPDAVEATQRCAQISGGGNGLYIELPEVLGPCKLTLKIGNTKATEFSFELKNASDSENAIATFSTTADAKMFKFEHTVEAETPVKFRIYNNGNQFNLHDILLTKVDKSGTVGVSEVAAEAEAPAVYYNLQGVRVENPAEGLYIRVKGNKVEKVVL